MLHPANVRIPKTKKGQKTFENIVRAAEKLFHEETYPIASIDKIVEEANVGVGTFYLYFDSKQDLFRYIVLSYHHTIRERISRACYGLNSRKEIERTGMRVFFDLIREKPEFYTIIWQSLVVDRELFRFYYSSFAEKYKIHLEHAQEKGLVKKEINSDSLAYALMGVTNFLGLKIIVFNEHTSDEEIQKIIDDAMHILENGIF